ncbi:hypothetical protein HN011_006423, partial [Eciton burchellii]
VNLICAKTKFAPLKTISIPCLELNAVVVLNRLLSWTSSALSLSNFPTYEWTDSTIILALKQYPSKWNTYFANRISEHYVAACFFQGESHRLHLSRVIGVNAIFSRLMVEWPYLVEALLHLVVKTRSSNASRRNDCVDLYRNAKGNRTSFGLYEWELPQRYSSWTQLVRVTAYILRFIKNSQQKKNSQPENYRQRFSSYPSLVPTSTESSFFKGVECTEQEQADSKF